MSIKQLHDDCLFLILDRVPLMDLILRVSLVSHKWNFLQNNLCIRKRNLALARDINAVPTKPLLFICKFLSANDYLIINDLSDTVCQAIQNRFPKIYSLEFYQIQFFLPNFLKLLNHWRCHLWSLKIKIIYSAISPPNSDLNELFIYLEQNDFISLRRLAGYTNVYYNENAPTCKLPNLPKLEELHIGYNLGDWKRDIQTVNSSWKNLKKFCHSYGFSNQVELIEVPQHPGEWYTFYHYESLCNLEPHITNQLTHYSFEFPLEWSEFSTPDQFMYHNFSSLTHLRIKTELSLDLILTRFGLHLLPRLRYLRVINNYEIAMGKKHKPLELILKPSCEKAIFKNLETLDIINSPHGGISLEQVEMSNLKVIALFTHRIPEKRLCKSCLPTGNYFQCNQMFISSILTWKKSSKIYYENKLYTKF